jgi:hypothetical protein
VTDWSLDYLLAMRAMRRAEDALMKGDAAIGEQLLMHAAECLAKAADSVRRANQLGAAGSG